MEMAPNKFNEKPISIVICYLLSGKYLEQKASFWRSEDDDLFAKREVDLNKPQFWCILRTNVCQSQTITCATNKSNLAFKSRSHTQREMYTANVSNVRFNTDSNANGSLMAQNLFATVCSLNSIRDF